MPGPDCAAAMANNAADLAEPSPIERAKRSASSKRHARLGAARQSLQLGLGASAAAKAFALARDGSLRLGALGIGMAGARKSGLSAAWTCACPSGSPVSASAL